MHRGVRRVLAAAVVGGAVLSGCGGPVQAGSAVIIGDTAVPLSQVQSEVAAGVAALPPGQNTPDGGVALARQIVSNDVTGALLDRQAAALGVPVGEPQVAAFIEEQGGLAAIEERTGLTADDIRARVKNVVAAIEIGRRAAPGLAVTADLVEAGTRAEAETLARTLAAGGEVATTLLATSKTVQRDRQFTIASFPPNPNDPNIVANTVIFGTPVGETIAFQPDQQGPWTVFKVSQRTTTAAGGAAPQLTQTQLQVIGLRMVQPLADTLGVRVNPRYGVWDSISLGVVAANETAGLVLPAAG